MNDSTSPTPSAGNAAALCTAWCATHDDAGDHDQVCVADQVVDLAAASPIVVEVERLAGRVAPGSDWVEMPPTIYLDDKRLTGSHEARRVARALLAAADIRDGVTVSW